MKTYNHIIFLVFSISTLILLSTSCNNYNGSSFDLILKKLLHSNNSEFVVTSDTHDGSENWNQVIKNEFGDSYRIADWNDLKSYHDKGGNIL
ncbi:hypothetical protein DF185_18615 [Marinifilum breve]|uniref:Uncharacterized protein n=1 Tax=Marinifilum breve TaxID=2184082 RepID=A0A2V3ZT43_9BACT|nr:hypothetical protein DF185_18615 [Marinifilum breve]